MAYVDEIPPLESLRAVNVQVPHEILPEVLPAYAAPWYRGDRELLVTFQVWRFGVRHYRSTGS